MLFLEHLVSVQFFGGIESFVELKQIIKYQLCFLSPPPSILSSLIHSRVPLYYPLSTSFSFLNKRTVTPHPFLFPFFSPPGILLIIPLKGQMSISNSRGSTRRLGWFSCLLSVVQMFLGGLFFNISKLPLSGLWARFTLSDCIQLHICCKYSGG